MKNKILASRLAGYSATAAAMAAISANADAQIVYSGLQNLVVSMNDTVAIDINNDGINDFSFMLDSITNKVAKIHNLDASNKWMGSSYVYALQKGNSIKGSSSSYFRNNYSLLGATWLSGSKVHGYFPGHGNRYVGVNFMIGTEVHPGWIKINIPNNVSQIKIIDWAYEQTPNTYIQVEN